MANVRKNAVKSAPVKSAVADKTCGLPVVKNWKPSQVKGNRWEVLPEGTCFFVRVNAVGNVTADITETCPEGHRVYDSPVKALKAAILLSKDTGAPLSSMFWADDRNGLSFADIEKDGVDTVCRFNRYGRPQIVVVPKVMTTTAPKAKTGFVSADYDI